MEKMRRSFTLLELIVVIIIIGVLATLGFVQYSKVVEKGRRAEGATNLGAMRSMAYVWHQEGGHGTAYPATTDLPSTLGLPTTCATSHYFSYSGDSASGLSTATRCSSGGKSPDIAAGDVYSMTLTIDGTKGGTW